MISEKNITRCKFLHHGACMHQKSQKGNQKTISAVLKLPLRGLVVLIDMNITRNIFTERGRSFRTFLKENCEIALQSCYLFTKKC